MRTLILNQTNLINDGQNNKMVYKFPNSVVFKDDYISFAGISMYYSWFNITAQYANNIFSYTWYNGLSVPTVFQIVIPDGIYEIMTINEYLQFEFIKNGHYLVNSTGDNVYYAELILNPSRYAVQLNTYNVPTSLPVGWSNPAGLVFNNVTFNPVIQTPLNFNKIIGFASSFISNTNFNNADIAPLNSTIVFKSGSTFSYISSTPPNVQPNSSLLLSLSIIDNAYSNPSSLLYTVVPSNVAIGGLVSERVPQFIWNKLIDGTYNEIRLSFLGNDLQPIKINDPSITIILVIRNRAEGS